MHMGGNDIDQYVRHITSVADLTNLIVYLGESQRKFGSINPQNSTTIENDRWAGGQRRIDGQ